MEREKEERSRKGGGRKCGIIISHPSHTQTGLIPRRRLMAIDQLLYNRMETHTTHSHTHITKAPKVAAQMYCAG